MTRPALQRPTFWEGQILAGADLNATVDTAAGRAARHERYLHDWGIGEGLELSTVDRTDANGEPFVEVTLAPGWAVDGTGREIVVPVPVRLSEPRFFEVNGAGPDPQAFYPVLLHGVDDPAPPSARPIGACGATALPSRVVEGYEVTFGALGGAAVLDDQEVPAVDAGPVPADGLPPWEVLVGFVRWRPIAGGGRFTRAVAEADGVRRRYAGVRADTVAARGGHLQLRTRPRAQAGEPAVTIGGTPVGLRFGLLKANGDLDERFMVDTDGNVTAKGAITGAIRPGEVLVTSGTATDGIVLPLPPGVTEQAVADGTVTLHVQLTPHVPVPLPGAAFELYRPVECGLDADRRVRCSVLWFDLSAPATSDQRPAAADYLLVATGAGAP